MDKELMACKTPYETMNWYLSSDKHYTIHNMTLAFEHAYQIGRNTALEEAALIIHDMFGISVAEKVRELKTKEQ